VEGYSLTKKTCDYIQGREFTPVWCSLGSGHGNTENTLTDTGGDEASLSQELNF